jgi:YVTN family beta-propeller protein
MNDNRNKIVWVVALLFSLQACASTDAAMTRDAGDGERVNDAGTREAPPPPRDMPGEPVGRKAYIGLFGDSAIAVLDVDHEAVVKTIPVTAPDGLIVTPDGEKVFVSSTDTGMVKVIATDTDEVTASIDVGAKPAGLAITPDGKLLVVAVGGADEAVIVDVEKNAVVRRVPVGQAHASCITGDGHYAYVGSQVTTAPALVKLDLTQDVPAETFAVDKSPRMLACESDRIYFTAVGLDAVEVFDPVTGKLEAPIPSAGSPHDVRAAKSGQTELVVSQTAGDLEFIDVPSQSIVARVPTGKLAHWITLSPDSATAYVTNEGDDNVSVVDLEAKQVTSTIKVGKAPRKMAIQP